MVKNFDTNFSVIISFFGVPSRAPCNYRSNVDLVHFIWDEFERFTQKKRAITILPADSSFAHHAQPQRLVIYDTKLLYVQHYRATSDDWRDVYRCDNCVAEFMSETFHLCNCRMVWDCDCKVCRRQPPSLRDMCSSIVFRAGRSFRLTPHTTFQEYAYEVEKGSARVSQLLPPEFPVVRLFFRSSNVCFDRKFHRDCPGEGPWHAQASRKFRTEEDAISALKDTAQKTRFGVLSAIKVFFPNQCDDHPDD